MYNLSVIQTLILKTAREVIRRAGASFWKPPTSLFRHFNNQMFPTENIKHVLSIVSTDYLQRIY